MKKHGLLTRCVHAGGMLDTTVGGMCTPVHIASAYRFRPGQGLRYPRLANIPSQIAPAAKIADLENGQAGLVFASGMGAIAAAMLAFLKAGEHAVIHKDIYGGAYHFITQEFPRFGLDFTLVSGEVIADFEAAVRPETRLLYFESPTNPLLRVVDIQAMAAMCRRRGIVSVMDNTFATPINQNPLSLGVDVVVHSATKYLGGHSDLCCGAVVTNTDMMPAVYERVTTLGATLGPRECSILERSLKTLGLRMAQHNANGLALARALQAHPRVRRVHYPGLEDHPGHAVAKAQMRGFGGMLSAELDCDQATAMHLVERLQFFGHAVSLGGVESLVCFPALTSHSVMTPAERAAVGISDSLVRFSCGIEDTGDLVADMLQALA